MNLHEILWRNQGNVLTPELIVGILQGAAMIQDRSIDLAQFGTEDYMDGFAFAAERFSDRLAEIDPLHRAQWEETEGYRHNMPYAPDHDEYRRMERDGQLVFFTVRYRGELVGHATLVLFQSRHSQTKTIREDAFFLRKDKRGGFTMLRFIQYMHRMLAGIGVREVYVSSKLSNRAHKLMLRAGYKEIALQLVAFLGEDHHVLTPTT